jgi:hypothetical protein
MFKDRDAWAAKDVTAYIGCCVFFLMFFCIGAALAQDRTAPAPSCVVGQKLEFRYDDGRSFTREIASREGELCVVITASAKSYYDKDWVLVKVVDRDGKTITTAQPGYADIGEKLLPFPLAIGKTWETEVRGRSAERGIVTTYQNRFTVLTQEEITVPAGTFKTFKIKHEQTHSRGRGGTNRWGVRYFWYAPEVGYYVKRHWEPKESVDQFFWQTVRDYELVSMSRPN